MKLIENILILCKAIIEYPHSMQGNNETDGEYPHSMQGNNETDGEYHHSMQGNNQTDGKYPHYTAAR